jgi:hypothetical protein
MKKSTKRTPSPAPATPSAPAPKTAVKAAAATPETIGQVSKIAAARPPQVLPSAPAAAPAQAAAAVPQPAASTVINARVDVGFGNSLHIRGEGPGLSWSKGVPMTCISSEHWKISLGASSRPVVFKLLVNDEQWSCGPDYTVQSGSDTNIHPHF